MLIDSQPEVTSEAIVTTYPIGKHASTSQLPVVRPYAFEAIKDCLVSNELQV